MPLRSAMGMTGTGSRLAAYYSGLFKTEGAVRLTPEEDISRNPVINGPEGEYAQEFQLMLDLDAESIAGSKTEAAVSAGGRTLY